MGMFDSVWVECPTCGANVDFQSKAGNCVLAVYSLETAPNIILEDIAGDSWACKCGHIVRVMKSDPEIKIKLIID